MFEILIDIICIKLSGHVLLKTLGIPMGINCALLLDDLSIMFRYNDDVFSLNKSALGDYIDPIYPQ